MRGADAARARVAQVALEAGGEAAADAAEDDPGEPFVRVAEDGDPYRGTLIPATQGEDFAPFVEGEPDWRQAGADDPRVAIEAAVASVGRAKREAGRRKAALSAPGAAGGDAGGEEDGVG